MRWRRWPSTTRRARNSSATNSNSILLLTRDLRLDPLSVKGSYAGAMGAPQFMPSNYRRYAVDADADGHIDLWNNWPDVCASVGNYLKEHGWNAGEPVLSEASVEAGQGGGPGRTQAGAVGNRRIAAREGRELRQLVAGGCTRPADRRRRHRRRSLARRATTIST